MYFYSVLINKKIPSISLTYKSEMMIEKGSLVVVLLRKNEVYGVVVGVVLEENIADSSKISEIKNILPYIFSNEQMRLQNVISYNTFNSPNVVFDAFINPILSLTQKDFKLLEQIDKAKLIPLTNIQENNKTIEYFLDTEVVLRIIYIIRTSIEAYLKAFLSQVEVTNHDCINILILFPEKKYLERVYKELVDSAIDTKFDLENVSINLTTYTGDKTKTNRQSIYNILGMTSTGRSIGVNSKQQVNIILSSRSGLFLPFDTLHDLLVVDESNSMYIQEQNSLYFDARELAFIISEVFGSNLHFISRVPSIRLHSFYPETILDQYLTNVESLTQKPLKIKITGQNWKMDKYKLISDPVLKLVQKKDDHEGLDPEVADVNFDDW
jgi:primosomal protein N'